MAEINLTRGVIAIVDDEDVSLLSQFSWIAIPAKSKTGRQIGWYAATTVDGRRVYLHRMLLQCSDGEFADHINGDGLNNRRSNLRKCSQSQNNANRRLPKPRSGYRGVYAHGSGWRAIWRYEDRKTVNSQTFRDPVSAAKEYDRMARERFGEFATVNFP